MLENLFDFLSGAYSGQSALHTRKIDRNIESLQQYEWFHNIYHQDQYRSLFFLYYHVRNYLQSNVRVNRMLKKKQAQERFILFLNKHLDKRFRSN
ncbi:hypothetical protein [Lysinibacillus sp. FSL M8-0134]|uniref:hypothetical protein n=1 Tax=Lysinibacillus sp. FSL M8-0134 TaxID=2921717 RepID=UPI0031197A3C